MEMIVEVRAGCLAGWLAGWLASFTFFPSKKQLRTNLAGLNLERVLAGSSARVGEEGGAVTPAVLVDEGDGLAVSVGVLVGNEVEREKRKEALTARQISQTKARG